MVHHVSIVPCSCQFNEILRGLKLACDIESCSQHPHSSGGSCLTDVDRAGSHLECDRHRGSTSIGIAQSKLGLSAPSASCCVSCVRATA